MNMISTGAFLNEMDASKEQATVAEKFAAVWEKKNAKAARAGGVSLMALSLAACGGSSSTTTTTSTDTSTDTTTDTTTTTPTAQTLNLTATTAGDDLVGGAGDDSFVSASVARLQTADVLTGGDGTDTLTAKLNHASNHDATIDGIEILNLEAVATAAIDGANISGATTVNVSGGATLTYKAHDAEVFTVSGAGTGLTVTDTGTEASTDAITVTVGAGKLGTVTLGEGDASTGTTVDYETINLIVDGDGSVTLAEAGTANFADSGDSIVVTGSGDYTLTVDAGAMGEHASSATKTVVDASGHTGEFTVDLTALDTTKKVVSGEGYTGVDAIQVGLGVDGHKITSVASGTKVIVDTAESDGTSTLEITPRTGSADTVNVELAHGTKGSAIDLVSLTLDGFESATVTASGTNKTETDTSITEPANNIDTIAGTATDTSLTIAGDQKLTAGVENTWTNITVTNTKATDLTVASGGDLTFTGGAGDDRLELDAMSDITSADTLKGGDGKDTLALSQVIGTDFSTTQLAAFSGFEVLEYKDTLTLSGNTTKTVDLTKITGVNELTLTGTLTTDSNDLLHVKAADGFVANVGESGGAAAQVEFQITDAGVAGSQNTVTVNFADTGSGVTNVGFTVDGVETVNLNVKGDFTSSDKYTLSDIDGAVLTTLNIASTNTGKNTDGTAKDSDDLTITDVETSLLTTVSAGSFTGDLDISGLAGSYAATGATITTGSGADIVYGGTGADTITTAGGGDTIRGGTGADEINSGKGGDVVLAGTGKDSTPEDSGIISLVGSSTGSLATSDAFSITVFGKAFTAAYDSSVGARDTEGELAAIIANAINTDADVGNLVTATATGTTSGTLRVVSKVDGDFTNFALTETGNSTSQTVSSSSGEVQTDGTASTDIDVINLGDGADFVHASGGADVIDLGAADGDADTAYILTLSEGGSKISNFEAGSIGTDVIKFAGDLLNNGTDTSTLVSIAKDGATVDNRVFFEITDATAAGAADTAAEIVTHLSGLTLTSIAQNDEVLFAVNDGSDTYLWAYIEDDSGSAAIVAGDLALVGVLQGVTDIVDGDLAQIA